MRWPGSVKTLFAHHIELSYTIVDLDIRYFAIHGYTVYVCGHRSAGAVTELPCAVTDPPVRSPNCPVRSPIRQCGHRSAGAVTELPCAVTNPRVQSPNCPAGEKMFLLVSVQHATNNIIIIIIIKILMTIEARRPISHNYVHKICLQR